MYWSTSEILQMHYIRPSCPVIRSVQLFGFLHISNNQMPRTDSAKQDKLAPEGSALDTSPPKFLNLYNPSQNLSPDESMLKFKGRLSCVQYMPKYIKRV